MFYKLSQKKAKESTPKKSVSAETGVLSNCMTSIWSDHRVPKLASYRSSAPTIDCRFLWLKRYINLGLSQRIMEVRIEIGFEELVIEITIKDIHRVCVLLLRVSTICRNELLMQYRHLFRIIAVKLLTGFEIARWSFLSRS